MPKNLTDVDTFTSPIVVPVGTDSRNDAAGDVELLSQGLANRTYNLKLRLDNNNDGFALRGSANTFTALNTFSNGVNVSGGNLYLTNTAGNLVVQAGDLTVDVGDIAATAGSLQAGTTIAAAGNISTSGGDITAATGDITATAGDLVALSGDVIGEHHYAGSPGEFSYAFARSHVRELNALTGKYQGTDWQPGTNLGMTAAGTSGYLFVALPHLGNGAVLNKLEVLYYMAGASVPTLYLTQAFGANWLSAAAPASESDTAIDAALSGAGWHIAAFTPGSPIAVNSTNTFAFRALAGQAGDIVMRLRVSYDDPGPRNY